MVTLPLFACMAVGRPGLLAGIAAALAIVIAPAHAAELAVGAPVGAYRLTSPDGQTLATNRHGRILVVNFWATWCPPCREEMPALDAFNRKYRKRGVEVVAVSVDDRSDLDAVKRIMAELSFPSALAADSDLRAFGRIRQVPATFVIDADNVLRRNGWREAGVVDLPTLEASVEPLLHRAP